MEYIITFKNTNFAVKAEQCLLERKLNVSVMPLPPQIRAGCGICLRITEEEIGAALLALIEKNIQETELFSRTTENNKYLYSEIADKSVFMEKKGGNGMEIIDALGKACPIPVVEAKKALSKQGAESILIKVDNIISVQNLEKMAKGNGYGFSFDEKQKDLFEVTINRNGKGAPAEESAGSSDASLSGPVVVIGKNVMGGGDDELGKILIKGFIYSLTELPVPPAYVIFLNSGAYLTAEGSNTIDDLKKLEEKGTGIFTCGTCANFYNLKDKLAVGAITDMYGITQKMASAPNVINI